MPVPRLMQALTAGGAAYLLLARPWEHWGASPEEIRAPLPGDDVVAHATWEATKAITIGAPPEAVWPWLAQMGYGRAGWYTYQWMEGHPDPGRIHPQYQDIAEGDLVPDAPGGAITWTVAAAEELRLLVYATARRLRSKRNVSPADPGKPTWFQASWAFILRPVGPDSTRLIVRWRHRLIPAYPALAPLAEFALGAIDALMHRKQLRGIKQRAQNAGRRSPIAKAVTIHERGTSTGTRARAGASGYAAGPASRPSGDARAAANARFRARPPGSATAGRV